MDPESVSKEEILWRMFQDVRGELADTRHFGR